MQAFAELLDRLLLTPARNQKIAHLTRYFAEVPDPDRGWALAALTGNINIATVKPAMIREAISTRMDPELFRLSYDYVGDLAETVSLAWPETQRANRTPPLAEVIETLSHATKADARAHVEHLLSGLQPRERWALIKLVTGGLRVGVSARLTRLALAEFGRVDVTDIEDIWHGLEPPYESLFKWLEGRGDKPAPDVSAAFRPVMLAHALIEKNAREDDLLSVAPDISPKEFAAEWKYDGIRVQAVADGDTRRLYSRTGDEISESFPDIIAALGFNAAIDGELLIRRRGESVGSFSDLQKRLGRKRVPKKLLQDFPAFIRAYDVLMIDGLDLRSLPFSDRRKHLDGFIDNLSTDRIDLSPMIHFRDLSDLNELREMPPSPEIEGVMLKRWDSPYLAGRPKGYWYKWKRAPYLIDVVLMYAQRGHGKRSGLYSDFTFGVWHEVDGENRLTPVGKTYFGFTDAELKKIDAYVRGNTIDRYGPVRSVTATQDEGLVFEVAFEGLSRSTRHKSGLAMRFPRINRIRSDKPPHEADRLATLEAMLTD